MDMHLANVVRRIAGDQVAFKASARVGIVTGSVDPDTYAAKVQIMPEGSTTGYLPLLEHWVGNGWGIVCPVSPGDQVLVLFQEDNLDAGLIWGRWYTDGARPPQGAKSGEFWLVHKQSGSLLKFTNDGKVALGSNSDFALTSGGDLSITGQGKATLNVTGDVAISTQGKETLSSTGDFTAGSSGGKAKLSASSVATVSAPLVMLGPGGGNVATMPAPARTLLTNYSASGPSAALTNPVAGNTSSLNTLLTGSTITTGLAGLVTGGTITLTDQTNITAALTGSNSLLTANTALTDHTNRLSGLLQPTTAAQPFLNGVIGLGAGLDYLAGGFFGSSATALPTMTTGLSSGSAITAAQTYAAGIVAALTALTVTPAQVITALNGYRDTLNGYVSADTAAYGSAQTNITTAGNFLGLAANAKNTLPAVQTLMSKVASAGTIATLQTV